MGGAKMNISTGSTTQVIGDEPHTRLAIAREAYRSITVYSPNVAPVEIDLSDNTNLWGAPPHALQEIRAAEISTITRYPSLDVPNLKRAIADYLDVTPDMIVTGCGSDDVLDCTMRAFGDPGDQLVHPAPSFGMIPIFSKLNGLHPVGVPLTDTFDADAEAMLAVQAKITYLCSPNNPTGNAFSREMIEQVADQAAGLVIIDEAYAEFARANCLELLRRSRNVLITRTMSKAFGLAGLRVGYGVADPAVIAEIEKSRGPYKVNAIAERAAAAALMEDRVWVDVHVREVLNNRAQLIDELRALDLSPLPSDANFVFVPVTGAVQIDQRMRERGVAVRAFEQLPNLGDALRIAVGPWTMLERCISVLREVIA
jgi:histidinol-phosphate aminotransferase